jgi:hypothetical protein
MNAPLDMGPAQLQAWVLSTYQRLERMDVPVFEADGAARVRKLERTVEDADLLMLPTDLPHELGAGLDGVTALSLILRYLAAPLRYEPSAEAAVHKAVPSARCMYPLVYALLVRTADGAVAYEYVPEFHALRRAGAAELPAGIDIAIGCMARVWRIAEKYGEFADFPCVLEAGHGLAQLGHLCASIGHAQAGLLDREVMRPLCKGSFEFPLFAFALGMAASALDGLGQRSVRLAGRREGADLANRFPRLSALHAIFDRGASTAGQQRSGAAALRLADMRRRQAGNDRSGIAAVLAGRGAVAHSLPQAWRALRERRNGIATESSLHCQLAWIGGGDKPAGLYDADGRCFTQGMPAPEFLRRLHQMLPYRGMRYNLSSLAAVLIIQADPVEAIARHGDSAMRDMHLAAGATAQDFSLAAASLGLFARPVRMMREASLESVLPLQGQVMYLVLCGFARRSNLTMGLL